MSKENIAVKQLKNKKKTIKEIVTELYETIGLISVHLKIDDLEGSNYQPWDVVSLSESKVNKHFKNEKSQLIQYTSKSFLRVYPKAIRIDSSNFDPTKSWICGAQLVSLNLQTLNDDYTLLNHLFFNLNHGCGYILKPEYLRSGSFQVREYLSAKFTLEFSILSGLMLQKFMQKDSKQIYITVKLIGTNEDDKNPCLKTDIVKDNFVHPLFINGSIKFSIFEENLSFLLIKIIDNNDEILARSVLPIVTILEGYKNILLYDAYCQVIENSILIAKVKKIF